MSRPVFGEATKLSTAGALPTAFRLFKKGWNDTEGKGRFLFDNEAARAVMAAYEAWGIDCMIDLEHASLNAPDGAPDPTARDARGWCKLELRNGELWATGVTWTPDGAQRLREKRQRYVSPAFENDPETKRVTKMINIALVALPATHAAPALVAASRRRFRPADMRELSASNPPTPQEATEALNQIARFLPGSPSIQDPDQLRSALDVLLVASGVVSADDAPDPEDATDRAIDPDVRAAAMRIAARELSAATARPRASARPALTPAQLKIAAEYGVSPEDFLALKRARDRA